MNSKSFLLVAFIGCAIISQASATCVFSFDSFNDYTCTIENAVSRSPDAIVDLSGSHIGGLTNADVVHVSVGSTSTFEEIPNIIFAAFANLRTLTTSPHLMRLNMENCGTNLQELRLSGNPLMFQLNAGALRGCQSLNTFVMMHSSIQSVDDNAFNWLPNLGVIVMDNNFLTTIRGSWFRGMLSGTFSVESNQITSIQPGAFAGSALFTIWLSNNRLTRIESGTFVDMPNLFLLHIQNNLITNIEAGAFGNLPRLLHLLLDRNQITTLHAIFSSPLTGLSQIFFDSNRINAVAPNFFDGTPFARIFGFVGNVCVDEQFVTDTTIEADIFPGMQTCFNNYV